MRVTLERINQAVHFKAVNEDGAEIHIDGSPDIGGESRGLRPMQLLLAGIGSCGAMDIVDILKKQRQSLEDIRIVVDGEREKNKTPALYTDIHVHIILTGKMDQNKVKRAVDLSMGTYCSVIKILEKTARVSYSFEIISTEN